MVTKFSDQEIVAALTKKIGALPKMVDYDEVGNLLTLDLSGLNLSQLPFPSEIGQLTNLQTLSLYDTQLGQLPAEIWQLTNLRELDLSGTRLSQLPAEIGRLTNLQSLSLSGTQLSQVPIEIGRLTKLQSLSLRNTQLSQLPAEIGQLTNLQTLYLYDTQLSRVPAEIGQLTNLRELDLRNTRLSQLPTEIGQLTNLQTLIVSNVSTLLTPPPEIVARGTADILAFLRGLQEKSIIRYESKLLIVGEGGTGKSSLLRALRNETFDPQLSSTHGIEVDRLELSHLHHTIILNTWDFGGQQIYNATHQFFLTKRSLYVVVWNARLGAEQGRLHYWLNTIQALAPDSPVLLVATHIDERAPDLNFQLYKEVYPQLVGNLSVSNKSGAGLTALKTMLIDQALRLPLMGQPLPQKWLAVEKVLLDRPEHHIDANTYASCCASCGVEADIAKGELGNYLHDLGKILYFRDDYVLSNLVVLKPNWVTKAISLVLEDKAISMANGILLHSDLPRIWATDDEGRPYEPYLYPIFLRLMERFYLSYQIEADKPSDHSMHSLIPQLLPYQPPLNLPPWPKTPAEDQTQVEMVYRFDFVPAGIMSWFIVHTHRYSQNQHWREGVLLTYQGHQARVELNPIKRELRLLVWGVQPHNFFTILMNTVDIILSRFQGLIIERRIPCICHWERGVAEPCPHFYPYEELVRRMEAKRYKVECPNTFTDVSVPTLLYGIHISTDQRVMADIQRGQQRAEKILEEMRKEEQHKLDIILEQLKQQSELIGRNFTRQWNLEMHKMEVNCPNTFILKLGSDSIFNPRNWVSQEYWLYLLCQHPPGPHQVGKGYRLRKPEEWWVTVSPWLNYLITFLKFAVPMGKAAAEVYDAVDVKQMQANINLVEEVIKSLPEFVPLDSMKHLDKQPDRDQQLIGPALRALYRFLNEADPDQLWGGLYMTPTLDGNILWLCDAHRQQYKVKPLKLDV